MTFQSSVLKEVGIQVHHSTNNKLFHAFCTHNDGIDDLQKPGAFCISFECCLVYIEEQVEIS